MKGILTIELFNENIRQEMRVWDDIMRPVLPPEYSDTFKPFAPSSWVAEITGSHPKYKYNRRFLSRRYMDYKRTNSKGSRGIYVTFILEQYKYYDVRSQVTWGRSERYYCKVSKDGDIIRVDESEVREWLTSISPTSNIVFMTPQKSE